MTEVFEHNPSDHEDPVPGPTWTIGIGGVVLLVACVLVVAAIFYDAQTKELETKVLSQPTVDLESLHREQRDRLAGPVRIEVRRDDEESLVIPIERAMELVAREASGTK